MNLLFSGLTSVEIANTRGTLSSFIEQAAPIDIVLLSGKSRLGVIFPSAPIPKEKILIELKIIKEIKSANFFFLF